MLNCITCLFLCWFPIWLPGSVANLLWRHTQVLKRVIWFLPATCFLHVELSTVPWWGYSDSVITLVGMGSILFASKIVWIIHHLSPGINVQRTSLREPQYLTLLFLFAYVLYWVLVIHFVEHWTESFILLNLFLSFNARRNLMSDGVMSVESSLHLFLPMVVWLFSCLWTIVFTSYQLLEF
jgi:hypothetical protein